MDITQALFRLLRRKAKEETIESIQSSIQSMHPTDLNRSASMQIVEAITPNIEEKKLLRTFPTPPQPSEYPQIQKESLQLGLAAGYTGRSLKEIESSLARIESLMVTKDWFKANFDDKTPEIIDLLKSHHNSSETHFQAIERSLMSLHATAERAPPEIKTELIKQIEAIESNLPLTPRMQKLVYIVKDSNEISYDELASRLGITLDSLRGLLTLTTRRTNKIQRFEKENRGWVRFTGD